MSDRCWSNLDASCQCPVRRRSPVADELRSRSHMSGNECSRSFLSSDGATKCPPSRAVEQVDVPLAEQVRRLEQVLERGPEPVCEWLREHWDAVVAAARERLVAGYASYGSTMYGWDDERRRAEMIEEVADLVVYMSSCAS